MGGRWPKAAAPRILGTPIGAGGARSGGSGGRGLPRKANYLKFSFRRAGGTNLQSAFTLMSKILQSIPGVCAGASPAPVESRTRTAIRSGASPSPDRRSRAALDRSGRRAGASALAYEFQYEYKL